MFQKSELKNPEYIFWTNLFVLEYLRYQITDERKHDTLYNYLNTPTLPQHSQNTTLLIDFTKRNN